MERVERRVSLTYNKDNDTYTIRVSKYSGDCEVENLTVTPEELVKLNIIIDSEIQNVFLNNPKTKY